METGLKHTQENALEADNLNSSYELIKRDMMDGTPFTMVETEEGCFLAIGMHRVTEIGKREELEERVQKRDWDLITQTIGVIIEMYNKVK